MRLGYKLCAGKVVGVRERLSVPNFFGFAAGRGLRAMEEMPTHARLPTVEEVFKDFKSRRAGILKALTIDVKEFVLQCDPEKENQFLHGLPDESWKVSIPWEDVPPELPEPTLGINFCRDIMPRQDWLSFVAAHSDAWLISVSYYYGAQFDQNRRALLFDMMNELPTVVAVVTGEEPAKEKTAGVQHSGGNKAKSTLRLASAVQVQPSKPPPLPAKEEERTVVVEEDEEDRDTLCGSCGSHHTADGFWIRCDGCEKWFHGICVEITSRRAKQIKHYNCPSCSDERASS